VEYGCDTPATDFDMSTSTPPSNITVAVAPKTVNIGPNAKKLFKATITGSSNTAVLWTVLNGPGTIAADGTYTAAATVSPTATAMVQASSVADPSKSDTATVTFQPMPNNLTFSPNPVVGGNPVTATVTLNNTAPTGGVTVTLASGTTSVATVPASVTVLAGAKTATFSVTTFAVTATTSVSLSATANGQKVSKPLTVNPSVPILAGFMIPRNTVPGGAATIGILTLNGAAPAGGIVVQLSSSDPSMAALPATVSIPAGATSASVTITTHPVRTTAGVTLAAKASSNQAVADLTLLPMGAGR